MVGLSQNDNLMKRSANIAEFIPIEIAMRGFDGDFNFADSVGCVIAPLQCDQLLIIEI